MSAYTEKFFSHPITEQRHSLIEHSLTVAKRSQEIYAESKFTNKKIAFYSGLLHDIGKLNPFYQKIFSQSPTQSIIDAVSQQYDQVHSPLSSWAADKLLSKKLGITKKEKIQILLLIYGHHSKLRKSLGDFTEKQNFINSKNDMIPILDDFSKTVSSISEFDGLDWESCINEFSSPVDFQINLSEYATGTEEFLETLYAFSCLLQADRGSFGEVAKTVFDISINTDSQINQNSPLARLRSEFQRQVIENFDTDEPISVINAPTGIGKTKVFLDLLSKFKDSKDVDRVFYFSPLLALTDDFEGKIEQVVSAKDLEDILSYSHIFSGSIDQKREFEGGKREHSKWLFENESFDKKFVITTTQRLLMTLFSNRHRENLKLASFRNSVLIIDEVQVIPKILLPILKEIFKNMNKFLGTKIILVSATIPFEIDDLPKVHFDQEILSQYLLATQKNVSYRQNFDPRQIHVDRTLVMLNTRQKAAMMFNQIQETNPNVIYMSSGVIKRDRKEILRNLRGNSNYILVSTQVVEAGVDVSFSNVYREICPLDNVIQVMGRLNREGTEPNSEIVIFENDEMTAPYLELDVNESKTHIVRAHTSQDLYEILPHYYEQISARNKRNQKAVQNLDDCVNGLDFEKTWEIVNKLISADDEQDSVFIPRDEEWESVRQELVEKPKKESFKKFGLISASLPSKANIPKEEFFDEELLENGILLPKRERLADIYDENLGLDIWLTR